MPPTKGGRKQKRKGYSPTTQTRRREALMNNRVRIQILFPRWCRWAEAPASARIPQVRVKMTCLILTARMSRRRTHLWPVSQRTQIRPRRSRPLEGLTVKKTRLRQPRAPRRARVSGNYWRRKRGAADTDDRSVISLMTTTTSDSGDEARKAGAEASTLETSVIVTRDRSPEVSDTEDRKFIKGDDEEESVGDDRESDPDYELTDETAGTPFMGADLSEADTPPPGFEKETAAATRAAAETEAESRNSEGTAWGREGPTCAGKYWTSGERSPKARGWDVCPTAGRGRATPPAGRGSNWQMLKRCNRASHCNVNVNFSIRIFS